MGSVGLASGPLSCVRREARIEERRDTLNLDAMRESIAGQVGDAPCSSPAVCRTLAMGAKPCGGPREYLVYSVSFSDSARLATEVARYNQADVLINKEKRLMSDCSVVPRPGVSCLSRRCVAMKSEGRQAQ